jgi:hypothetical protein
MSVIPAVATTPATTVRPIKLKAVTLCARSAHTLPTRTAVSKLVSLPRFAFTAAARRRAIFCCADSFGGAWPKSICEPADVGAMGAAVGGPLEVNRVAWEGERGILATAQGALIMGVLMSWSLNYTWLAGSMVRFNAALLNFPGRKMDDAGWLGPTALGPGGQSRIACRYQHLLPCKTTPIRRLEPGDQQ